MLLGSQFCKFFDVQEWRKMGGGTAFMLCVCVCVCCVYTRSSEMGAANSAPNYSAFEEDSLMGGGGNNNNTGGTAIMQLTPTQSCSLHGWANPKRTLAWEDLVRNPRITLQKCIGEVHALF